MNVPENNETGPSAPSCGKVEKTEGLLAQLNQDTLCDLKNKVEESPTFDLWLSLREASRRYKVKRDEYLAGPVKEDEPEPVSKPKDGATKKFLEHNVSAEGDVRIILPLAPEVADLLSVIPRSTEELFQDQLDRVSRTALSDVLKKGELLYQPFSRAVVRIAPDIVVKLGRSDDTTEIMNLVHIHAASKKFPIPKPLGMLSIERNYYMFTSYIPGIPLDRIWVNLTTPQKEYVRQQLNDLFTELRALPLPSSEGFLGGGDPVLCLDGRRWVRKSTACIKNEAQFNDFLLSESHASRGRVELAKACLRDDHLVVMTHGDLHPRNIIVDDEHSVQVTGIIDWETGGGYPEYWEYVKALSSALLDKDDWHCFLPEDSIGAYLDEYVRDNFVERMMY
ncbi:MAG: hypothetical protein M4579_002862 [Chaenotheca gracillima]|nr:MAG: hypothetical protein M4579_002862 [Chaenotheca gracillima]